MGSHSSGALSGIGQLAWLKFRHLRTEAVYWGYAAGTDIVEDTSVSERIYQLYVLLILAGSTVSIWGMALSQVEGVFAEVGRPLVSVAAAALWAVPLVSFAALTLKSVRTSPLRFTDADTAFIATGQFSASALVAVSALFSLPLGVIAACCLTFLLADGMMAGHAALDPWQLMAVFGLIEAAVILAARLIGCARLARASKRGRLTFTVVAGALALALSALLAAVLYRVGPLSSLYALSQAGGFIPAMIPLAVAVMLAVCTVAVGKRVDLICAIEESGAYAQLFGVRHMRFSAPDTYRELARRYRVSHRRFRPRVPLMAGPGAFIMRALMTHLRQPEGILSLLVVGLVLMPSGALVLSAQMHPATLFIWGYLSFGLSSSVREMGLAVREDVRVRAIRDLMPQTTLVIALLDAIPALVFVGGVSLGALGAISALVMPVAPSAFAIALLLGAAFALSAAFDALDMPYARLQPSVALGVLIMAIVACLCALLGDVAVCCGLVILSLVYLVVIGRSR